MSSTLAVQQINRSLKKYVAILLVAFALLFSVGPMTPIAEGHRTGRPHRHRSFWKKHRDKLTVAGTALGGAAVGGLAGGKKGAAIGALVGGGGGAVYTYKLRRRHRRR